VYWRGSPDSGLGHVGFYMGETATQILTLGGNESDAVREQFEPKSKLRGTGGRNRFRCRKGASLR